MGMFFGATNSGAIISRGKYLRGHMYERETRKTLVNSCSSQIKKIVYLKHPVLLSCGLVDGYMLLHTGRVHTDVFVRQANT